MSTLPKLAKCVQTLPVNVSVWQTSTDLFQGMLKLAKVVQNLHIFAILPLILYVPICDIKQTFSNKLTIYTLNTTFSLTNILKRYAI